MAWIETHYLLFVYTQSVVATREGGVDRNIASRCSKGRVSASPPARVAWIETIPEGIPVTVHRVATREGGVDRNFVFGGAALLRMQSPPARVAWIETPRTDTCAGRVKRRHPRGWRG